jgi:chromosomal replication initiator protein
MEPSGNTWASRTTREDERARDLMLMVKVCVATFFEISVRELDGHGGRPANLAHPRQVAMHLCREMAKASFPAIAQSFNKKSHKSPMYAGEYVTNRLATEPAFAEQLKTIRQRIADVMASKRIS